MARQELLLPLPFLLFFLLLIVVLDGVAQSSFDDFRVSLDEPPEVRGMHGRLAAEKSRLLNNANSRLQLVIDRIHRMVDSDDLARADELQKTEAALLAERDLDLHLSTWPWSTATFRGLLSAVMLPIFIGVVIRLLTRVI